MCSHAVRQFGRSRVCSAQFRIVWIHLTTTRPCQSCKSNTIYDCEDSRYKKSSTFCCTSCLSSLRIDKLFIFITYWHIVYLHYLLTHCLSSLLIDTLFIFITYWHIVYLHYLLTHCLSYVYWFVIKWFCFKITSMLLV